MKKLIILIAFIIILVFTYNYIYQDHRDINSEQAEVSLTSTELYNEFIVDPSISEKKYLNKTIEVSGVISDKNIDNLTIDDNVFCQFSNNILYALENNSTIKIKGRFIGYDDLLEQIKLDQCTIIKK